MTEEEKTKRDTELNEVLGNEHSTRLLQFADKILQYLKIRETQQHKTKSQTNSTNNINNKSTENMINDTLLSESNSQTSNDTEERRTLQLTRAERELWLPLTPTTPKEKRTRIHQLIKTHFPYLQTETKLQRATESNAANSSIFSLFLLLYDSICVLLT